MVNGDDFGPGTSEEATPASVEQVQVSETELTKADSLPAAAPEMLSTDMMAEQIAAPQTEVAGGSAAEEPTSPEPAVDTPAADTSEAEPESTDNDSLQQDTVKQAPVKQDAPPVEAVAQAPPPSTAPPVSPGSNSKAAKTPVASGHGNEGPTPRKPRAVSKIVEGLVTAVSAEEVELTLDDGRLAVINRRNFGPGKETPLDVLSVGDRAFGAELQREDPKSRVVLSRSWALKAKAWEAIVAKHAKKEILQAKVVSVGSKGVVVDVGVRGFIPSSHLELNPIADMSVYTDQVLDVKILEVDPKRERLVLSRRSLLMKQQRKDAQQMLGSIKKGEIREGVVSSITDFGAFVDLGGVNGLVHLTELSWVRVGNAADVVSLGETVTVKVLDVDTKRRRIGLSMRRVSPDPLSELEVGSVVFGPVTRLADYGAFVSLGKVEGLVHVSEMAEYRVAAPEEVVIPGDEVGVKIMSVDRKRRRVELSIRRAAEFG